jgi:hypothetical protein
VVVVHGPHQARPVSSSSCAKYQSAVSA